MAVTKGQAPKLLKAKMMNGIPYSLVDFTCVRGVHDGKCVMFWLGEIMYWSKLSLNNCKHYLKSTE